MNNSSTNVTTSRTFSLTKDYHNNGVKLYKKGKITFTPGVTVLVGCNGIGKTTMLKQIEQSLKNDEIPCIMFNNLTEGGHNAISEASFNSNFGFMAAAIQSSEGENIVMNIENLAARLGHFVKEGDDPKKCKHKEIIKTLSKMRGEVIEEKEILKERWVLLDAVDSGLSVDNIVDLKEQLFNTMLKYNFGNDIYIIISANEYEMARGEQCFDVYNGKYVKIKDYEEYRDFVLKSKEWKNAR